MSTMDTNTPKEPFSGIRRLLRNAYEAAFGGFITPKSIREANKAGAERTRAELKKAGAGYGVTYPRHATNHEKRKAMHAAAQHLKK